MDHIAKERRHNRRYPLRLPLQYRLSLKGEAPRTGSGMTMDMSANGISFRSRRPLPPGAHIEIVVNWPAKHADMYPIDLQLTGFVVRSDPSRTAVRMTSKRFKIAQIPAEPIRATA